MSELHDVAAADDPDTRSIIWTIGHGTLPADDFARILHDTDIDELVDVRSFPGSRHNPQFGREEMERWLPEAGIDYRWMRELGGRRPAVEDSKHVALRHVSFRAYADYMETPEFLAGVDERPPTAQSRGRELRRDGHLGGLRAGIDPWPSAST